MEKYLLDLLKRTKKLLLELAPDYDNYDNSNKYTGILDLGMEIKCYIDNKNRK